MWQSGPWLRRMPKEVAHHTELAMVAVRPGDRVIVVGAAAPALAASLARVTGLNGQLVVVDDAPGAAAIVAHAADRTGVLVEFRAGSPTAIPAERESADLVVLVRRLGTMNDADRQRTAAEAWRVARPGGRAIAIEGGESGGFLRMWRKPSALGADDIGAALAAGGWKASRAIGEVGGALYVEATKPRTI